MEWKDKQIDNNSLIEYVEYLKKMLKKRRINVNHCLLECIVKNC